MKITPVRSVAVIAKTSVAQHKDTAAPADLAPSTLGIHGPLADAWAAADKPTEPSA